jgi:RNA polymerase sigma-70 factor (ECF subfamily)
VATVTHPALDPAIVERARAGERSALSALLDHHYDQIHRMLVHLVGRSPDLDDLRQQVLLAIVQGIGRFRGESELSTWIGGICVNVARAHHRGRRSRDERTVDDGQPAIDLARGPDAAAQLEHRAELAAAEVALAALSAEQRAAFVLATVYGHSVEEIAQIMGAARSTTRLRLYYGRKKFHAALGRAARGTT